MPILNEFKTISQLYLYLTEEYINKTKKPLLKYKENKDYTDISIKEFKENTDSFAFGLASLGIKRGDKVAIIAENRPEWVYSDFAVLGLGGVDVPLYPISTSENIQFMLKNSESKAIIVSNKFHLNKVQKIWSQCRTLKFIVVMNDLDEPAGENIYSFKSVQEAGNKYAKEVPNHFRDNLELSQTDDLCTIIYTSGTTGEPKGVMLTHQNIMSNVSGAHVALEVGPTDTFLSFLPLCHIFERTAGYYVALAGGSTIAYAESIEKVAQNLTEIKPTVMTSVPRLFERMYSKIIKNIESQPAKKQKIFNWALQIGREYTDSSKEDKVTIGLSIKHRLAEKLVFSKLKERTGGRLRFFISGGAALARELGEFFESAGILILEGYGLTESSPVLAVNRENDYKFGTVGKVFPGVEIKIAKDGEILACGPNIMQGYFKNRKETELMLKDGWLHTGDIGVFDAEGFLLITDRKKHLFKTSGGKYIAPTPIENMFLGSKYIEQFVLIGDRRMFLSALIVPDYEAIKEFADAHRIQYENPEDLVKLKQIYELLENDLAQFQRKLASYERVRKFTILDKPLTIENGEITPTLKVKRKVIEERYRDLIDDMYKK